MRHRSIGRVRARFGAAISAFDADGDGKLDLYLAAAVIGPKGVHDVLLLNKGDGRFEDASAAFGLPLRPGQSGRGGGRFRCRPAYRSLSHGGRRESAAAQRRRQEVRGYLVDIEADGAAGRLVNGSLARPGPGRGPGPVRRELLRGRSDAERAFTGAGEPPAGLANSCLSERRPTRSGLGCDDSRTCSRGNSLWNARGRTGAVDRA